MTREEAKVCADNMTYREAVCNALQGKCIPYRKATLIKLNELLDWLEAQAEREEVKGVHSIPIEPYKVNVNINNLPETKNDPIGEEIERQFKIRAAKAEKTTFPLYADGELVAESEQMSEEDFLNLCRTAVDDSGQQN